MCQNNENFSSYNDFMHMYLIRTESENSYPRRRKTISPGVKILAR